MTIREAHTADLVMIRDLAHAIWPDTYGQILSSAQIRYMLEQMYSMDSLVSSAAAGHRYLLVEDTTPVGFAAYQHDYEGRPVTRIHKIYVLPQTQGQGIGQMLIKHIESLALLHGSTTLSLNVNRSNRAVGFYQKLGFNIVEQQDIPIGEGYLMEDYRMEKKLQCIII